MKEAMKLALDALGEILESFEKDGKFCKSSLIRNELFDRIKATFDKCKSVVDAEKQEQGEPSLVQTEATTDEMHAIGQGIMYGEQEQGEPVAWLCNIETADFEQDTITLKMLCGDYKVSAGLYYLSFANESAPQGSDDK
jgi:hypothetical protein